MPNNSGVVGVLRALLTADTAQFDTSMRKAVATTQTTTKAINGLTGQVAKLTPQAERMVKAFGGDRLLRQANNLVAAVNKIGGASKLTDAELKRVNGTITEAIAKYKALGQTAPPALIELQKQTGPQGLTGSVKGLLGSLGPFAPAIGAAFSATAVIGFVKSIGDAADSLVRLRDQTGISFQGLQRLQRAGDDAGNSIDEITASISQMQRRLAEAKPGDDFSRALQQLKIDINEFRSLDPASQFMAIGDALKGIEDPALRTALAMRTMGRTGAQVLPTLTRGFDDLRGHVVGMADDSIESLDEFGDTLTALARRAKDEGAKVLSGALDVLFPFRDVLRTQSDVAKQLDQQMRARQQQIESTLPKLRDLTMSEEEAEAVEKRLTAAVQASIDANEKRIATNQRVKESIDALYTDVSDVASRLENAFDKIADTEFISELSDEISDLASRMQDLAERTEPLAANLSELDAERMRALLAQNAPGTGFQHIGRDAGETIGQQMTKGIADAFEQVPHFLTSSIIHSGSFINGLKAIGVDMADAIVEPLIKRFIARIAGAKLMDAVAGGATGAAVGAGAAAASSAAGGAGAAATAAGGFGGTLAAFATNPFTIAAAGAAVGGFLLFKHFSRGSKANDIRDKDLAQFAAFDTHRDANNPPGFYGLSAYLAKQNASNLFNAFIGASSVDQVRKNWTPIAALSAAHGKPVKSFAMGGFVPPGVVQPAILHGPEWIIPQSKVNGSPMMSPTVHVTNQITVSAIDAKGVRDFLRSDTFAYEFGTVMERNLNFIATRTRKGLAY